MGTRPQHAPAYQRLRAALKRVRAEAGLTQRDLGRKLRRHHTVVHKTESGDRRIDPVEFIAWCRACGVDPKHVIAELERA